MKNCYLKGQKYIAKDESQLKYDELESTSSEMSHIHHNIRASFYYICKLDIK
ncbi:hypothetical protein GCM10007940_27190 [Portibacter lacus]|uniref:Uncharacterized protein n=1 Tax=Portibacter lacus TaxID=1099794 RepID=A0AA37WG22_9BACT|nr:hypothetical protein GCM10007940_27190 [Portibacter lacus]